MLRKHLEEVRAAATAARGPFIYRFYSIDEEINKFLRSVHPPAPAAAADVG